VPHSVVSKILRWRRILEKVWEKYGKFTKIVYAYYGLYLKCGKVPTLAIIPQNNCLRATFGSGAAIFGLMVL